MKTGGCGKRFCLDHRYEKVLVHYDSESKNTYVNEIQCCVVCGPTLEEDIKINTRIGCASNFCCTLTILLIVLIPILANVL